MGKWASAGEEVLGSWTCFEEQMCMEEIAKVAPADSKTWGKLLIFQDKLNQQKRKSTEEEELLWWKRKQRFTVHRGGVEG